MIETIRRLIEGAPPQKALEKALAGALAAASVAYGAVAAARGKGFDRRLFQSKQLPVPVVCIGNLTVGGTGKTPVTAAVAKMLIEHGERPAIISRGYGATQRKPHEVAVVCEGAGPVVSAAISGDEPCLLAHLLPQVPLVVGADRYAAGLHAIERFQPTILLLDDGFQHRQLHRDFDFVLLDATRDPNTMQLFPRGPLREPFSALKRASLIGLTRADQSPYLAQWQSLVHQYAPATPTLPICFVPSHLMPVSGGNEPLPVSSLRNKRIYAFCAIGNPRAFYNLLEKQQAHLAGTRSFPDHHVYTQNDLALIASEAQNCNAQYVITTDKDATKLNYGNYGDSLLNSCPMRENVKTMNTASGRPPSYANCAWLALRIEAQMESHIFLEALLSAIKRPS